MSREQATSKTTILAMLAAALAVAITAPAQQKPATAPATAAALVPVKVTVVLTEYEGGRKTATLPYVLSMVTSDKQRDPLGRPLEWARVRIGSRVPISVGKDGINYDDVGTSIDCGVTPAQDGQFRVQLSVERNSVYPLKQGGDATSPEEWRPGGGPLSSRPIMGGVKLNGQELLLRDGQTAEATKAVDPITGHLWKIAVTLNVVRHP